MGNCHSGEVHRSAPGGLLKRPKFTSRKASSQLPTSTQREATKDCGEGAYPFNDFSDSEDEGSALLLHSTNNIFKAQRELWNTNKHWNVETDSRVDRTLSLSMDDSFSQEREINTNLNDVTDEAEDDEEEEAYIVLRPDSDTASTLTFASNDSLVTEGTKTALPASTCKVKSVDLSQSHRGEEIVGLRMDVLFAMQTAIKTCKEEIHYDLSSLQALT